MSSAPVAVAVSTAAPASTSVVVPPAEGMRSEVNGIVQLTARPKTSVAEMAISCSPAAMPSPITSPGAMGAPSSRYCQPVARVGSEMVTANPVGDSSTASAAGVDETSSGAIARSPNESSIQPCGLVRVQRCAPDARVADADGCGELDGSTSGDVRPDGVVADVGLDDRAGGRRLDLAGGAGGVGSDQLAVEIERDLGTVERRHDAVPDARLQRRCVMSQEISDTRVSRHLGQNRARWCGHFCDGIGRVPETEPSR